MKKAFSFVEVLIVVAILGILTAATMPLFSNYVLEAKESAAKDNLRILRSAIEMYAAQHKDIPPGDPQKSMSVSERGVVTVQQLTKQTNILGEYDKPGSAGYIYGPYITTMPYNPFNKQNSILAATTSTFTNPVGTYGWLYNPVTRKVYLNSSGKDKNGVRYFDY